jgi:hypothetical protein
MSGKGNRSTWKKLAHFFFLHHRSYIT